MVVLMEECHGLKLKRKGADEPELFDAGADDRSGFPLSCRATKMRRLACPAGGPQHQGAPAEGVAAAGQDDVPMCDDDPAPASAGGEEAGALVLYGGGGRSGCDAASAPRLAAPRALHGAAADAGGGPAETGDVVVVNTMRGCKLAVDSITVEVQRTIHEYTDSQLESTPLAPWRWHGVTFRYGGCMQR